MLDEVGWSPLGLRIPCDTERSLISGILHRIFLLSEKIGLRLLAQLVRSNRRHSTGGGFEPPPGRIYPACEEKKPLAVLPLSLAVRHGSWATEPGPCGYGPAQWATEPGP